MRDAYTSMVSNNLSDVMKFLTAITLVISIPTMIASFYGMNFQNIPFSGHPLGFLLVVMVSFAIGLVIALWLKHKRYL
jgi:magnesium transporter